MNSFWRETINVLCVVALFAAASKTVSGIIACLAIAGIVLIHNWKTKLDEGGEEK